MDQEPTISSRMMCQRQLWFESKDRLSDGHGAMLDNDGRNPAEQSQR